MPNLKDQLQHFIRTKVPMTDYAGLEVVSLDEQQSLIKVPFTPENKNHVNSMYFGALAIGADGASGLLAQYQIMQSGKNIVLVFKDFQINFLRRAEGDVYFTCNEGEKIKKMIEKVVATGERVNEPIKVTAVVKEPEETVVAECTLTLSLK